MTPSLRSVAAAAVLCCLTGSLPGQQRVRPPEFESGYRLPTTSAPHPRQHLYQYVDIAVLLAALAAASWLALKTRSRAGLFGLMIFSLLYFGFWRGGCVCPIGAIQNVSLAMFDPGYAIPLAVLAIFLLPLVFALFFGRTFCAAVCPLGAVQDLVALRPVSVPGWLGHALGLLAYVYLAAAVLLAATGSAFLICRYDPFVAVFRLLPLGQWIRGASRGDVPGGIFTISGRVELLVLAGAFLAAGVFIARPYCRFLCPLGAIFRPLSSLSRWHVTITPDECVQCRLCEESCPFGAIREPTAEGVQANRGREKMRLALLLVAAPALIAAGGLASWAASGPMSIMHYKVRLAERVHLEQTGQVEGTTDASDAFRQTGQTDAELYQQAAQIQDRLAVGGIVMGAFVGLVIAMKLIALSVRRGRTDYQPDRATCLSCGRCFAVCPVERKRRRDRKELERQQGA